MSSNINEQKPLTLATLKRFIQNEEERHENFLHKTSSQLVNAYSLIGMEKLQAQEMAEGAYGKQINDAGWSSFANMLAYKAENAGCQVIFVDPRNTTKTCHVCGNMQKMPLHERTYDCDQCGSVTDRDINAAINVLHKATTEGHSESRLGRLS